MSSKFDMNAASCVCKRCGRAYGKMDGYFRKSYAPLYRGSGYLPYCNDCIEKMFTDYLSEVNDSKLAIRQMCRKLDLYWSEKIFNTVACANSNRSLMSAYIQRTNTSFYAGKSYDDTLREADILWKFEPTKKSRTDKDKEQNAAEVFVESKTEGTANADQPPSERSQVEDEYTPSEDVLSFWGPGYTNTMYRDLQNRWDYYVSKFLGDQNIDIGTEVLIKQICNLEIDINRDRAAGKPVDKYVGQINTILGSLSLKPVQKKEEVSDNGLDTTPFGVWIERWENEQPVPEPDPELEDADGVIRYIHVWFFGHLSKLLGLKNIYSKMYEDEIARYRVEKPEYEDLDDEEIFDDVFGAGIDDDGDEP